MAGIDTLVAILAGFIIFPAAFSVGIQPDAGPSLLFITLPNVFQQAFGNIPWLAIALSIMFYVLLALAALTSTISLHEVVTAYLHEEFKFTRGKAAKLVTAGCIVLGVLCSLSLGVGKSYTIFGLNLFDLFDFVTAKIMLPLGGFFISIFTGWYLDKKIVWEEVSNNGTLNIHIYRLLIFILKYIAYQYYILKAIFFQIVHYSLVLFGTVFSQFAHISQYQHFFLGLHVRKFPMAASMLVGLAL